VYKSSTKFGIAIYYLVPVLHALVVGRKSVKRTEKKLPFYSCTSLNFEETSHEKC